MQGPSSRRRRHLRQAALTIVTALSLLATSALTAAAQEGTPADGVAPTEIATEVPTEVPTEAPTEVPTQVPTEIPTEAPTEAPATETVVPATEAPTEVPTEPAASTLSYAVAPQPTCEVAPDQPAAIASGGTIDYLCTDSVAVIGANVVPAGLTVTWTPWASVDGGWAVQLLPPVNPGESDATWTDPGLTETWFEFHQVNPLGAGNEPVAIDQTVTIQYSIRLTRAACAADSQTLTLDRSIAVASADPATAITATPVVTEPRYLTPELAPIPEPSVAFDGPLTFGEVGVTATGPETTARQGSVSLTISNLNQACGDWTLATSATPLTDADGAPLDGSRLLVVSVNGQSLPEACDLTAGCDLASLATGPDATATRQLSVGVELRLPERPDLGSFDTSLTAALHPAAAD